VAGQPDLTVRGHQAEVRPLDRLPVSVAAVVVLVEVVEDMEMLAAKEVAVEIHGRAI
jgi:hypothetical protein